MTQNEPLLTEYRRAFQTLDIHHAMRLACSPADLRRSGWTFATLSTDGDPTALLFDLRPVVRVVIPAAPESAETGTSGVAALAPELREPVIAYLRETGPDSLGSPAGLRGLDDIVRHAFGHIVTSASEAYRRIAYTTPMGFRPYAGHLQEWMERLDETAETDLMALRLLARYSGGVYVIRRHHVIAAHAGIRVISPHVAEIEARTDIEELRNNGLARAVSSRATKAVLASGRVPVARITPSEPAQRLAASLGYRLYGDCIEYYEHIQP